MVEVKKKNRCSVCTKRIGINYFICSCNKMFCSQHKFPFEHECQFDWKEFTRNKLKINNPKIYPPPKVQQL